MIAEIFFEQALTANGFLEALLAIAYPSWMFTPPGPTQGLMIPPASWLVAASPDAVDGSLK